MNIREERARLERQLILMGQKPINQYTLEDKKELDNKINSYLTINTDNDQYEYYSNLEEWNL